MHTDREALVAAEALRSRRHPHGRVRDEALTNTLVEALRSGITRPVGYLTASTVEAWRAALVEVDAHVVQQVRERWRADAATAFQVWDSSGTFQKFCVDAAVVFPDASEIVDGVIRRLANIDFTSWQNRPVCAIVGAARSLDELQRLLQVLPAADAADALHPWTAVASFGDDALAVLEALFVRAGGDVRAPQVHRSDLIDPDVWATYLDLFATLSSTTKVLKPLIVHGEHRSVQRALLNFIERQPRLLLHTALSAATRPGLARDLAAVVLRRDPALIDVATTELQRATLLPPDAPLAATSSLPVELQTPPWAGKKPGKGVVLDGLMAPALAPQLVWRPGQQEQWASSPAWPDVETASSYICGVKPDASVDEALAHVQERRSYPWSSDSEHPMLSLLPEPLLRGMWAAFPVTAWHLDTASTRRLVARLGLDVVDGLLARAGFGEVPHTHTAAGLEPRRTRLVAQSLDALLPVASLQVVPLVVTAISHRDARRFALSWLETHAALSVACMVPLAVGAGAARAGARMALQVLAQRGHRQTIIDVVTTHFDPDVVAAVQALLNENPLALAKAPKRPAWVVVRALAPVFTTSGERLDDDAVGILVDALSVGTIDVPYAGLEAMTAALDRSSVSALSWSLFRQWWLAGTPNADGWVLSALGHVGDERVAAALVEQMTVWAGDGLTARAKTGVQVLTTMASRLDAALLALFRFSKRAPSKSLSRAATEAINAVALSRNLSVDELADRLVPDLGLDGDGTTTIELGDRTLTVRFDGLLRPTLKDSEGNTVPSLPRLSSSMDAALHAEAKVKLKQLTKAAAEVGTHMVRRLESALAEQRRWPVEVALSCVLRHALLQHVAQRLVWTDHDDTGAVLASFRVAEDGTFADIHDDTYRVVGTSIGLLHPLQTSPTALSQWRAVYADYELQQPFAQLDRPVFVVDDSDVAGVLQRFVGVQVPTGKLFSLEARGWQRGAGTATRRLDGVEATLHYTPGIFGGPDASKSPQTLGVVELAGGRTWSSLPPLLYSELLHDVERLRA